MNKYIRGKDSQFTHTGLMCGFIPVFVGFDGGVNMEARYWWAEYLMDFMDYGIKFLKFQPQLYRIRKRDEKQLSKEIKKAADLLDKEGF